MEVIKRSEWVSMSNASKQLSVYLDPFSTSTFTPKIPDGKAPSSIGARHRCLTTLNFYSTTVSKMIILYPGMNTYFDVFTKIGNDYTYEPNVSSTGQNNVDKANANDIADDSYYLSTNKVYSHWRQVSLGLKLSLISGATVGGGYYESIRVPVSMISRYFQYDQAALSVTMNGAYCEDIEVTDWSQSESYESGGLRDLSSLTFSPVALNTDHDFKMIDHRVDFAKGRDDDSKIYNNVDYSSLGWNQAHRYLFDGSFEIILIRLIAEPDTTLLARVISNHELLIEENNVNRRFHTDTSRSRIPVSDANEYRKEAATNASSVRSEDLAETADDIAVAESNETALVTPVKKRSHSDAFRRVTGRIKNFASDVTEGVGTVEHVGKELASTAASLAGIAAMYTATTMRAAEPLAVEGGEALLGATETVLPFAAAGLL